MTTKTNRTQLHPQQNVHSSMKNVIQDRNAKHGSKWKMETRWHDLIHIWLQLQIQKQLEKKILIQKTAEWIR